MGKKKFNPKSELEKHGWEEGSGLGRNEHGIKQAIKVKIKADSAGVGHNPGEEFTFHWWDHMFNKAANNINVKNSEEGVSVSKCSDLSISTKKEGVKTLASKELLYGRFVKSATLTHQGVEVQETPVNSDSDDSDEDDIGTMSKATDEDLMRVCGGRTAHKAARHGLGLSGKLARLAEQDQSFSKTDSPTPSCSSSDEGKRHKHKKSKKRKREIEEEPSPVTISESSPVENESLIQDSEQCIDEEVPRKKSKKKKKKKDVEVDSQENNAQEEMCNSEQFDKKTKKKKKKKSKTKSEK